MNGFNIAIGIIGVTFTIIYMTAEYKAMYSNKLLCESATDCPVHEYDHMVYISQCLGGICSGFVKNYTYCT